MASPLVIDDDPGFVQHWAIWEALDMRLREGKAELFVSSWVGAGDHPPPGTASLGG